MTRPKSMLNRETTDYSIAITACTCSGGSRFLQLGEGAIYMLDQLSCAVGALHFGEIWNQLGGRGPQLP